MLGMIWLLPAPQEVELSDGKRVWVKALYFHEVVGRLGVCALPQCYLNLKEQSGRIDVVNLSLACARDVITTHGPDIMEAFAALDPSPQWWDWRKP